MLTFGAARSIAAARSAAAFTRCSQLSKISSVLRVFRWLHRLWISGRPGSSCTSSTRAASAATSTGSWIGARSRNQTPSG